MNRCPASISLALWFVSAVVITFSGGADLCTAQTGAPTDVGSIAVLQREYLTSGLARAEQSAERLKQGIPALKSEVDQLIAELGRVAVPPPAEAKVETKPKKVEFRPPMAYRLKKRKEQIALVCENRRLTVIDVDALKRKADEMDMPKRIAEALTKAAATKSPQIITIVPEQGHFDQYVKIEVKDGGLALDITGQRKAGHDGEDASCLLNPASEFRRLLDRADPEDTYIYFAVYPSSFEIFRQVRQYVWSKGNFEVGWFFLTAEEAVPFGGGGPQLQ